MDDGDRQAVGWSDGDGRQGYCAETFSGPDAAHGRALQWGQMDDREAGGAGACPQGRKPGAVVLLPVSDDPVQPGRQLCGWGGWDGGGYLCAQPGQLADRLAFDVSFWGIS